jgi:hypothetical protein
MPQGGPSAEEQSPGAVSIPAGPVGPDHAPVCGGGPADKADRPLGRGARRSDWADDVLVGSPSTVPMFGALSTDYDATNGDIYVALLDPGDGFEDTVWVWRSTDAGRNWTALYRLFGSAVYGGIEDVILRVGGDAGGTWVYNFIRTTGGDSSGVWCVRMRADGSSYGAAQVEPGGDSIVRMSVDRNTETPQHLFVGWQTLGGGLFMMSCSDSGLTWANRVYVAATRRQPAVCAGGGGYVYIAYMDDVDSTYCRVGRATNNLVAPVWAFVTVDSNPDHRFRDIAVAAARSTPGDSQTAVALATCRYASVNNIGPRYGWTRNGGVSWSGDIWPVTNQARATWDARFPSVRCSYGNGSTLLRAVVVMRETTTEWDTIVYAFTRPASPNVWESRATPNDFRQTGEFAPVVDYSSDLSGGYVAYREYGARNVFFDGWNWTTGVEGERELRAEPAVTTVFGRTVRFNLTRPTEVRAVLHDRIGRAVAVLARGRLAAGEHSFNLPARLSRGVYFLRLDMGAASISTKVVRFE